MTGKWKNITPASSPSARGEPAVAYDAKDGYLLLFGGCTTTTFPCSGPSRETWKFSGGTWTKLSPVTSPSGRDYAMVTYDARDGYVLLFGGWSGSSVLSDTWKYVNGTWTNITSKKPSATNTPPARDVGSMAYDALDREVVLFGGVNSNGNYLGDTWTFVHGVWRNVTTAVRPSGREGLGAFAYSPKLGGNILFGGYGYLSASSGAIGYLNDTWRFSHGTWTNVTVSPAPHPEAGGALTYDARLGYLVLFGGKYYGPLSNGSQIYIGSVWAYNGAWTNITPAHGPAPRSAGAFVYDPSGRFCVLFGGHLSGPSLALFGDTWKFT